MWEIIISKIVLPGLVVAIVTSILTVRLSIRRFYAEKWWEKKHEIYSRLFEALHHRKKYALEHLEAYEIHREIPEDKKKELEDDWKKFSREYEKIYDLASFQLSKETVAILDEYKLKKKESAKSENIYDWIDSDATAAIECIKKLSMEAKNDLKIKWI